MDEVEVTDIDDDTIIDCICDLTSLRCDPACQICNDFLEER